MNKKGTNQLIAWTLIPIMIYTIMVAYMEVGAKTKEYYGTMGSMQNSLLRNYHKGEIALIYIDQAAKYSVYNSILPIMENGGFLGVLLCGYDTQDDKKYAMWQEIYEVAGGGEFEERKCYPQISDIRKRLRVLFNYEFDQYAEKYPVPVIPKNNYDLVFGEKEGEQEIIGIATQNIQFPLDITLIREKLLPTFSFEDEKKCLTEGKIPSLRAGAEGFTVSVSCKECPKKPNCNVYVKRYCNYDPCDIGCEWRDQKCREMKRDIIYSIKPSFRLKGDNNFLNKFYEHIEKAKEIEEKVGECLGIGSGEPDDDDLITCVSKVKEGLGGLDDYKIESITYPQAYTLLVEIEDESFDIYTDKKSVIRYGIRILDNIAPPPTQISSIEERDVGKVKWYKNYASDVFSYELFYKEVTAGETAPGKPIEMSSRGVGFGELEQAGRELIWNVDYENTDLEKGKEYYFYIRARDDAGNFVEEMDAEPVRVSI